MAMIAVVVAAVLRLWGLSVRDRHQQLGLLRHLGSLQLAGALGPAGDQTSGPGFGILAPVYAGLRHLLTAQQSYDIASLVCIVPLAVATVAAVRSAGVPRRSAGELGAVSAVLVGIPVLACYLEAFHPADVLATAATLGAFAASMRRRLGWAAVLLGFGLATRQWVVAAIAVLAVVEEGQARWTVAGGSLVVFGLLVLPFAATDPSGTLAALAARGTVRGGSTLAGLLPLSDGGRYLLSRYLPLVAIAGLCWWLASHRLPRTPTVVLAALAIALSVRAAVDPAGFVYYAAPGYATVVLLVARRPLRLGLAVGAGVLLYLRMALHQRSTSILFAEHGVTPLPASDLRWPSVVWSTVATALLVAPVAVGIGCLRAHGARRTDDRAADGGVATNATSATGPRGAGDQ